jgi:S1-C subfamily serine protease
MLSLLLCLAQLSPSGQDYPQLTPDLLTPEEREEYRWTPVVGVVRQVAPAVVFIQSERPTLRWDLRGSRISTAVSTGSGVVIEKSGYIVTNFHVVGEDARRITVQFDPDIDSQVYAAELISFRAKDDLALLKIEAEDEFPVVVRGTSSDLWIGERVIAIGNPFQQKISVSTGIISGLHRDLEVDAGGGRKLRIPDLIQTDAAINPGNSGGPLLNILGELVGINTAVNPGAENMGFAIPVDRVEEVLFEHLLAPSASRAWLGFEVDEADTFCITKVTPGGPAAEAGIEEGDRLVAIGGQALSSADDFRLPLLQLLPHQPVRLGVVSGETERELVIRGWDRTDGILWERLGMTVESITIGSWSGVRVSRVAPGSPSQDLGLQPRDVVDAVRVGRRSQPHRLRGPDHLAALVVERPPGTEVWIDILRDDNEDGRFVRAEVYKGKLVMR